MNETQSLQPPMNSSEFIAVSKSLRHKTKPWVKNASDDSLSLEEEESKTESRFKSSIKRNPFSFMKYKAKASVASSSVKIKERDRLFQPKEDDYYYNSLKDLSASSSNEIFT